MIKLSIPGKPIAKKRPRFVSRGKFHKAYNDQETEEGRFLFDVKQQYKGPPLEGPIHLCCWFEMYIPKSTSKKKQVKMATGQVEHTKRPDLDNLIKFVKDCLNGTAWKDDSQVVSIQAGKRYSETPQTVILIHPSGEQP